MVNSECVEIDPSDQKLYDCYNKCGAGGNNCQILTILLTISSGQTFSFES